MKVRAALQMESHGNLSIREVELEEPHADEVLVKISACGICHTDIMMQYGSSDYPFLLGHEGSGIIERIGSDVTGFAPGDHIVISYTSCGHCPACKRKQPYKCVNLFDPFFLGYREDGTSSVSLDGISVPTLIGQGSFSEYVIVHQSSLVKVDPSLDLKVLAPLGCGMMTGAGALVNYLKPEKGASILICGLGAVGFGAVTAAKMFGCETIIVIDRIPERLRLAEDFGATHSINSGEAMDITAQIRHICSEIDYGYDSTGSLELLSAMQIVLKRTAKACGVGGGYLNGFNWQITDEGYSIPQEMIPVMIDWYVGGQFPIEKLLRFYPFEKINEAMMAIRQGEVIKPVIVM